MLRAGSGALVPLHFNKATDRRRLVKAEDAFTIAETHSPVHLAPITVIAPFAALARVAVSGLAGKLVVEDVVQDVMTIRTPQGDAHTPAPGALEIDVSHKMCYHRTNVDTQLSNKRWDCAKLFQVLRKGDFREFTYRWRSITTKR